MAHPCKHWGGSGEVVGPRWGGDGKIQRETCYYCQGDGKEKCPACNGTGTIED